MKNTYKNYSKIQCKLFTITVLLLVMVNVSAQTTDQLAQKIQIIELAQSIAENNHTQKLKAESGTVIQLDSIHEFKDFGFFTEYYKWYYNYNYSGILLQNQRLKYNSLYEWLKITEIRHYNVNGLIAHYSKTMPKNMFTNNFVDETIGEQKNEKYTYNNNTLIQLERNTITRNDTNKYIEILQYDSSNKLKFIIEKTFYADDNERTDTLKLIYNDNDQLLYELANSSVTKYNYTKTDSSLTTLKSVKYLMEPTNYEEITEWDKTFTTIEKYNTQNLLVYYKHTVIGENYYNYDYYATFSYTTNNLLEHVAYFKPNSLLGTDEEQMRIDYSYNEHDNVTIYSISSYNEKVNDWQVSEQKTYYYSEHIVGNALNEVSAFSIYPNPAKETIFIKNNNLIDKPFAIKIYSMDGKTCLTKKVQALNNFINVSSLKKGLYFVSIQELGLSRKLIISD